MPRHPETEANRKPNERLIKARARLKSPQHLGHRMSRNEMADAVNVALNELYSDRQNLQCHYVTGRWIGNLERGDHHWASVERRAALRKVTGAATDDELGLYPPRHAERGISIQVLESGTASSESKLTLDLPVERPMDLVVAATGRSVQPFVSAALGLPGRPPSIDQVPHADGSTSRPSDFIIRVDSFLKHSVGDSAQERDYQKLVSQLVEWAQEMKRRDVLQWLSSAAAAAAAAPVLDGLDLDERDRVVQALARPDRVDNTVISHIDAVLWRCMRQDDSLGPQAALDTVLAQRNLVLGLLPAVSEALKDRLLSIHANLSRFAGWLSFDLNNYVAAAEYYEDARTAAHQAHDTALGAFVLCNMSHLATWRGRPRTGIDHAVAALGWASQTGDHALKAYAWDVAARAYAMDKQEQSALSAIDKARDIFATGSRASQERSHVYFYGQGQLASTRAVSHLYLDQPEQGVAAAEAALAEIDESFVRNLALTSVYLGICHARAPRPDVGRAAKAIGDAATLAAHNRSPRLIQHLRSSWINLEPWGDEPEVKHVRQQLVIYGIL